MTNVARLRCGECTAAQGAASMAERVGFEPTARERASVFRTDAISRTLPPLQKKPPPATLREADGGLRGSIGVPSPFFFRAVAIIA